MHLFGPICRNYYLFRDNKRAYAVKTKCAPQNDRWQFVHRRQSSPRVIGINIRVTAGDENDNANESKTILRLRNCILWPVGRGLEL